MLYSRFSLSIYFMLIHSINSVYINPNLPIHLTLPALSLLMYFVNL